MIESRGEQQSLGGGQRNLWPIEVSLRKRSFEPSLGEKKSEIVRKKGGFLQKVEVT